MVVKLLTNLTVIKPLVNAYVLAITTATVKTPKVTTVWPTEFASIVLAMPIAVLETPGMEIIVAIPSVPEPSVLLHVLPMVTVLTMKTV